MMKIVFTSSNFKSPSFLFYADSFQKIDYINRQYEVDIKRLEEIDYRKYDVALFMGFLDKSIDAKKVNPSIITGVVEPRADQKNTFINTDFIVVNSIESKDYFSKLHSNFFLYFTYPEVPPKEKCTVIKDKIIIGYHGNKIHLESMSPRIIRAIDKLNSTIPVELWAMYNIEKLGKWEVPSNQKPNFTIKHIPFSVDNYSKYIANVDIGIVPQLIPIRKNVLLYYFLGTLKRKYNERAHNYLLRFKETTNIGRHLVFAQYKIPIISDMTPSACSFINDGDDGFLVYHTDGWYRALNILASNENLRKEMGEKLYIKYKKLASSEVQNKKFIDFMNNLKNEKVF